jgi:hypothetical protein
VGRPAGVAGGGGDGVAGGWKLPDSHANPAAGRFSTRSAKKYRAIENHLFLLRELRRGALHGLGLGGKRQRRAG